MKSQEQFIEEMEAINHSIEIIGQYNGTHNKTLCRCKKCGFTWEGRPHDLLVGHGCPKCSYVNRGMKKRKSNEVFLNEMNIAHPEIEIVSKYISRHDQITVKCKKCLKLWTATPGALLSGSGCPDCAKKNMGRPRISVEEFLTRLNKTHSTIVYEKGYSSFSGKATFSCSICGYRWEDTPQKLLKHKGCPRCVKKTVHNKISKTTEQFRAELSEINPNIVVLGEYATASSSVRVKCKICGHEWSQKPNNLLHGSGCPNCAHASTSYIEQLIRLSFSEYFGDNGVLSRDRKTIGKELDVYIPTIKTAIEYGAWLWHKNHMQKDLEKYHSCLEKGIRLIRIYDACGNDKSAEGPDVYLFEKALSKTPDQEMQFICWLFKLCNLPIEISESRFQEIKNSAYKLSRRKTTELFREELKAINPKIIVTGEYQYDNVGIAIECKECGYKWSATPSNLLQGWGCPRCSHKLKRTQEQFVSAMEKQHPTIKVVGKYASSNKPVTCKCMVCGYLWNPHPSWLLNQDHGCPKCAGKLRWTHQEFVQKMDTINSDILIIGAYKNSSTKIECKCKNCGHIWNPTPHNLIRGSGCPKCSRKR